MKIQGDYHIHSGFSGGGHGTIDDIAREAKERGLTEFALTEHGPGVFVGCKPKHFPHIRALLKKAEREHDISALFGIEANLMDATGRIDVMDEWRRDLDIVLLGIHPRIRVVSARSFFTFFLPNYFWIISHFLFRFTPKRRIRKNTEAMIRAIEKNNVDIWTHPNKYFKLDVVQVAKTCAEYGTLIELNAKNGISFRPIDFERMLGIGAKFIVNSDAHRPKDVGRVDRVAEFLKNCDYKPEDIVNLNSTFQRPKSTRLEKLLEEEYN